MELVLLRFVAIFDVYDVCTSRGNVECAPQFVNCVRGARVGKTFSSPGFIVRERGS